MPPMTPGRARPRWSRRSLLRALATMPAWPAAAFAAQAADDGRVQSFALAAGAPLALRTIAGTVRVEGVPGRTDVQLRVARRGDRAVLAAAPILVDTTGAGVRIDVTPGLAAGTRGVSTDVVLQLPPDVTIDAIDIDDGRLDLDGLRGAVRARVTRGGIRATAVSGVVRLETSMGDVVVTRARLTADGLLRLRTFNGDVRLAFEAPPDDARIMALALNGTISSTIPLTSKDGWGPRWGEASIGRADRVVSLDVVTGTIRIEVGGGR